jgi:DNA-binding transcriptional LysR family regulator
MSSWPDLQVLHVIALTGSLAGAGRMLGVRHTTVGRRLDDLERLAGGKLVDRMSRGTVLTSLGRELAEVAAGIDEMMATAGRKARSDLGEVAGMVSVAAPPLLSTAILAPGLAALLKRHPALSVVVESSSTVASLIRSEADIALRLGDPVGPSLLSRRLGTVRLGLYATLEKANQPESDWQFIGYSASLAHLPHHKWLEDFAGDRPVAFRTNDVHAQREAAASGIGIAMLPCAIAKDDRRLVRVGGHEPPARPLWLLVHPDIRRSSAVSAVIDHLVEIFASDTRFQR